MTEPSDAAPDDEAVDRLAESLADGSGVDWELERSTRALDRGVLDALEFIARVSRLSADAPPPSTLDPLPDGTPVPAVWGSLRLESAIGCGAFGTVFRARDVLLDQHVAVKVLRPGAGRVVGRIVEEGRRLARLHHPNIVRVICIDEHDDLIGLRMEFVDGLTLAEILDEHGPLPEQEAIEIGIALCHALATTHAAGVLHRDVKARNVMRDREGRVILMDLGAGTDLADADGSEARGVVGTPLYIAPEVLDGGAATPRSDLYSLGVLLYHLVSGDYPARASSVEALRAALSEGATPLGDRCAALSNRFTAVVDRALARNPADRYLDADEMAAALAAISGSLGGERGVEPFLPRFLTRYVGHDDLRRDIRSQLREHRLVTLTGAGGCGKTRTAVEVAWSLAASYPDGVWFVELAPVEEPSLVASAIASAVGAKPVGSQSPLEAVTVSLADRHVLLVLDNCEHVATGCAEVVAGVLQATEEVRVLATSRESLRVPGEVLTTVSPLELPDETNGRIEDVRESESVRLFTDRARAADGRFQLTEANAEGIARICRRVDGIPLGIELAAVHVGTLPIVEIAQRIDERFLELSNPDPGALPHHRMLRTLIGWSYDLLSRAERVLLRRLSVFAGGWTTTSAAAVCADESLDAADVGSLHFQLVARSLITLDPTSKAPRYGMLDTIRAFVTERLEEEESDGDVRRRHQVYFLERTRELPDQRDRFDDAEFVAAFDRDHDNLRAALRRSRISGNIEVAIEMAANLSPYWELSGRWHETRAIASELARHPDASRYPMHRAVALRSAGSVAAAQGDLAEATKLLDESLEVFRALNDEAGAAHVLNNLAILALDRHDAAAADELFSEALAVRRRLGDTRGTVQTLVNLSVVAHGRADNAGARRRLEEALSLARGNRLSGLLVFCLRNLATTYMLEGRPDEARVLLEEAVGDDDTFHELYGQAVCATDLGAILRRDGRLAEARVLLERALRALLDLGDVRASPITLAQLALLAEAAGEPVRAVRLHAAADKRWLSLERRAQEVDADELEQSLKQLRATLGDDVYAEAWAHGERVTPEVFLLES